MTWINSLERRHQSKFPGPAEVSAEILSIAMFKRLPVTGRWASARKLRFVDAPLRATATCIWRMRCILCISAEVAHMLFFQIGARTIWALLIGSCNFLEGALWYNTIYTAQVFISGASTSWDSVYICSSWVNKILDIMFPKARAASQHAKGKYGRQAKQERR